MIVIAVIAVIAAVIIGITGVVASGLPFFYGIIVGAIAAGGLSFLLTGWWRPARRGDTTRSDPDRPHPGETRSAETSANMPAVRGISAPTELARPARESRSQITRRAPPRSGT